MSAAFNLLLGCWYISLGSRKMLETTLRIGGAKVYTKGVFSSEKQVLQQAEEVWCKPKLLVSQVKEGKDTYTVRVKIITGSLVILEN